MFENKEEKLKTLASRGDALAEYYLGKYYIEEVNSLDEGITWLLRSSYVNPQYASLLLTKLSYKYPAKIKKLKKNLKKDMEKNSELSS